VLYVEGERQVKTEEKKIDFLFFSKLSSFLKPGLVLPVHNGSGGPTPDSQD
jgi:hypothetical protein